MEHPPSSAGGYQAIDTEVDVVAVLVGGSSPMGI